MSKLQTPRGTRDLLFDDAKKFQSIRNAFEKIAETYNFHYIETPIFESAAVFNRSLGESTDIVSKEMYSFEDRGGDLFCLRPEGTAPIARAFLSNSLTRDLPLKLYYHGPMFRYERPQKGRYRQFYQLGVEVLGLEDPLVDAEVMALGQHLMEELGLASKVKLFINSLGDSESRTNYRGALVDYYKKHISDLSEDSKVRLEQNPLRILDSKSKEDINVNENAPKFANYMNEESIKIFERVQKLLTEMNVAFETSDKLVRGLDYYSHCVFEFRTTELGAQDAVNSGGRYDGLIETMGGPATPGMGFAAGLDRIMLLLDQKMEVKQPVAILPLTEDAKIVAAKLSKKLRSKNVKSDFVYGGNLSKRFKKADKMNASHAIVIGESEVANGEYSLKDLKTGEQRSIGLDELIAHLA